MLFSRVMGSLMPGYGNGILSLLTVCPPFPVSPFFILPVRELMTYLWSGNIGHLLHLPTRHLAPLLSTILALTTIHSPPPSSPPPSAPTTRPRVPAQPIVEALESEYGVPGDVCRGVMDLCGSLEAEGEGETWVVDLERMVAEVGKGVLQLESVRPSPCFFPSVFASGLMGFRPG